MWMTRDVFTIVPAVPIREAAAGMARRRVRRLPIVDAVTARLVGIVTLTDLARAFPPDVNPMSPTARDLGPAAPVATIMTQRLETIVPEAPLEEAARRLVEHKIGALPVTRNGKLEGIITESDIFRALVEALGGRVPGVTVTFELGPREETIDVVTDARRAAAAAASIVSVLAIDHERRRLGIVKVTGGGTDAFIAELGRSGHAVISVSRGEARRRP